MVGEIYALPFAHILAFTAIDTQIRVDVHLQNRETAHESQHGTDGAERIAEGASARGRAHRDAYKQHERKRRRGGRCCEYLHHLLGSQTHIARNPFESAQTRRADSAAYMAIDLQRFENRHYGRHAKHRHSHGKSQKKKSGEMAWRSPAVVPVAFARGAETGHARHNVLEGAQRADGRAVDAAEHKRDYHPHHEAENRERRHCRAYLRLEQERSYHGHRERRRRQHERDYHPCRNRDHYPGSA